MHLNGTDKEETMNSCSDYVTNTNYTYEKLLRVQITAIKHKFAWRIQTKIRANQVLETLTSL